jgi:hypothetical protein
MYKIPKDEEVKKAILKVLEKNREIESQKLFLDMVLKELRKISPYYVVSKERLKKMSTKIDGVNIFIEKRRSSRAARKCFICGGELETFKVRDLLGGETSIGSKCKSCGFKMDKKYLAPRKYIFYRR